MLWSKRSYDYTSISKRKVLKCRTNHREDIMVHLRVFKKRGSARCTLFHAQF
jgi:hypothetical protein